MKIVVTGGAGYIGSAILEVLKKDHELFCIDDLSKGTKHVKGVEFLEIDILNKDELNNVFEKYKFDCVIHCAAKKSVEESEKDFFKYVENNIVGTINVLNAMDRIKCKKIIFSSSAAIYESSKENLKETDNLYSNNNYAFTKIKCEDLITEYGKKNNVNYVIFRYFNVVGDIGLKYIEKDSVNILPVIMKSIKNKEDFLVFGNDYDTEDGTCVRDYVHLEDVVNAHVKAIDYDKNEIFNLGSGKGISILELLSKIKTKYKIVERRKGDIGYCVADIEKAKKLLGYEPKKNIDDAIREYLEIYS